MSNAPKKFKFCKDCWYCHNHLFNESTCLHPEENWENYTYLSTGKAKDAEKTQYSRMNSSACGPEGTLFEARK